MKQKIALLATALILVTGILGVAFTVRHLSAHAAGTPLFSDNFDSYTAGPLPTGTGATQWTTVNVKGTGFALAVSTAQAKSKPNSLQVSLGSGLPGHAWAEKDYTTVNTFFTHTATFNLYLDPTLALSGHSITLLTTRAHPTDSKGSIVVLLTGTGHLQVIRYDSKNTKVTSSTGVSLLKGQWYSLELDQTDSRVAGSWSLLLNGTQFAGQTGVDTGTTPVNTIIVGDRTDSTVTTMAGSFYIDDVQTTA